MKIFAYFHVVDEPRRMLEFIRPIDYHHPVSGEFRQRQLDPMIWRYGRNAAREMKTDVHEHEDHYEVDIDLPGFKKEDITLELQNGYLTVTASKGLDKDKTTKKGKVIRQERWAGTLQRSFYVGDALTEADIGAKLEHGVLSLNIPKKDEKKLPEKKVIMIEG